jgi:predicted lipoprotein with Yx(FWY)xxD motif
MIKRWAAGTGLAAVAVIAVAACGSSSPPASHSNTNAPATNSSSPATTSGTAIRTAHTKVGTVLVNAAGHTLYWFAKDTSTKSNCTGSCATYWPPVIGKVSSASGLSMAKFGTITRSNGQLQATYEGHPLYTYAGDSAAGQVNGNGKNLSGGLWWAMTPSGAKPSAASALAPSPSPSSSSSGGGYGY